MRLLLVVLFARAAAPASIDVPVDGAPQSLVVDDADDVAAAAAAFVDRSLRPECMGAGCADGDCACVTDALAAALATRLADEVSARRRYSRKSSTIRRNRVDAAGVVS